MVMADLHTLPEIEECIFCLGEMRVATRREVEARLRNASPEYRAAVEQYPGTWYVCPRCGPESVVKWQSIGWD
jgi:hypothetical protein